MNNFCRLSRLVDRNFLFQIRSAQTKVNETLGDAKRNIPTLFVPGRYGEEVYQIVKPFIDPLFIEHHLADLQRSCDARGISMNMQDVSDVAFKWKKLKDGVTEKSRLFGEIMRRMKQLDRQEPEYTHLDREREAFYPDFAAMRERLHEIEDSAMHLFKNIPNLLHPETPIECDRHHVVKAPASYGSNMKSHVCLGSELNCLEFFKYSPTAYYLSGELAVLEQAVAEFFSERLQESNYIPLSSVDFCKSFIVEACGKDPYSPEDAITIKYRGKDLGQKHHLVGSASLEAMCAYFININVNKLTLPMRYYSFGRMYDSRNRHHESSLYSVVQSTAIHSMVVSDSSYAGECFNSLKNLLSSCYSQLDLPFRIVEKSAKNLNQTESRKICFELWSPARNEYIQCGDVAQCNDFISRRLLMTYGIDFTVEGFLNIVHGCTVRVPVLLGCIMENLQNADGTFTVPEKLKQHMVF